MTYAISRVGRVFAVRWSETTREGVEAVATEARGYHRQLGQPLFYLSVTGEECKPPTDDARQALVDSAKSLSDICEKLFVVLEGQGFRGSVLRSVLASLMMLSKMRGTIEVAPSIDEALSQIAGKPGYDDARVRAAFTRDGIRLSPTGTG